MKPESRDYIGKARQKLDRAERAAQAHLPDIAAREAYFAALAAARAVIFDLTGSLTKTHSGTAKKLHELVGQRRLIADELMTVLDDGREMKSAVDYDIGPLPSTNVSTKYLVRARQFVAAVEALLTSDDK
jgi:uncharacterized protein (UPF0332 family)